MADSYRDILARADAHFASVAERQPQNLSCRAGCTGCCHGLFEITAADVAVVAEGLDRVEPAVRQDIERRAAEIWERSDHPVLREVTAGEKEDFFDRTENVPCPALGDDGRCRIYESRPIVCRTFGLTIRDGARYLGEECELNFTAATPAQKREAAWDLQWEDVVGSEDEFTVVEAVLLASRLRNGR